jgi:hypothetical protein
VSEASSKPEGRWLWVPPSLILVGVAVFGIAQAMPEDKHPNRQERTMDRAIVLCEAHVPAGHQMSSASPLTARQAVAAARFLRKPTAPWDQVSGDHFIAQCSYTSSAAAATSPTTICNGDIYSLYQPTQVFLDEDGRTSRDYGFESLPPVC